VGYVCAVNETDGARQYRAMTLADLAGLLTSASEQARWRLIAEFLEEHRWKPTERRLELLADEPPKHG
jgi:hypothetical protein